MSRERQRINCHAWNRTRKQQWEMVWALKERREKQNSSEENVKKYEFERFVPLYLSPSSIKQTDISSQDFKGMVVNGILESSL